MTSEDNSTIKAILGLITFSTILPIKVNTSLKNTNRMLWLWPFIHLLVGILGFAVAIIFSNILNLSSLLTGALVYGFLIIFNGFHHADGLMDMADGVMVCGNSEKKISVMKDSFTGSAGIASFFLVGIVTVLGITSLIDYNFMIAIIIGEMVSKTSLLTTCITSKSDARGTGALSINSVNIINYSTSLIVVLIISFVLGQFTGIIGVIGAMLAGAIISIIGRKNFKIANGDVLGASNEFGRMLSILLMVIFMSVAL